MNHFLEIFLLYLPAFVANSVPVIVMNIPKVKEWKTPLCEKYLGKNKTWRGLVWGIGGAIVVALLQFFIAEQSLVYALEWGFLLGLGALGGDAVESFFKRQLKIAPGKPLPILDGIDYIVGALILGSCLYVPTLEEVILLLILGPVLSLLSNVLAYFCKLKNVWH